MANKNFFETLTQYRLKVEKEGKSVVDIPGIFALPGLLLAPKLSITGLIAAPFLGLKVLLENDGGEAVNVEETVRKAAETVKETVTAAAKTIREEVDKAWETMSADDPEPEEDAEGNAEAGTEEAAEESPADESNEEILKELKAHEESDVPTIEVKPDDSARA